MEGREPFLLRERERERERERDCCLFELVDMEVGGLQR
jgi:hypothetical protein